MKDKLKQQRDKFDALPIRMRLMITFAAVLLLAFVVDLAWISGNSEKSTNLKAQISAVDNKINQLIISQNQKNATISGQRRHPARKQLDEVERLVTILKSELEQKTVSLIKPEVMASVLKEIVERSNSLKLISLVKQPPVPLFEKKPTRNKQQEQVQMYRHSVELQFEGNYSDTLVFLEQLELMPQKVNFEHLQYAVDQYPKSKVNLVVSTLSLERKWIGG